MSAVNHKIALVCQSDQSGSLTGYDLEGGATETTIDSTFPANSTNVALTMSFTQTNLQDVFLVSDKGCTLKTNGINTADVQTVSISGTPTGGSFSLDFNGQDTVLAFNAVAATVQTALRALSNIGGSNITCTGGPLPGTPVVCTFSGTLNTGRQVVMTAFSGALTGGSTPTVTVAHTTSGTPQDTIVLPAGIPLQWGRSAGFFTIPFFGNVSSAFVTTLTGSRLQGKLLSS